MLQPQPALNVNVAGTTATTLAPTRRTPQFAAAAPAICLAPVKTGRLPDGQELPIGRHAALVGPGVHHAARRPVHQSPAHRLLSTRRQPPDHVFFQSGAGPQQWRSVLVSGRRHRLATLVLHGHWRTGSRPYSVAAQIARWSKAVCVRT